jgi:hypothetical protein
MEYVQKMRITKRALDAALVLSEHTPIQAIKSLAYSAKETYWYCDFYSASSN